MRLALALLLLAPLTAQAGGLFTPDTSMVGLSRGGANVANVEYYDFDSVNKYDAAFDNSNHYDIAFAIATKSDTTFTNAKLRAWTRHLGSWLGARRGPKRERAILHKAGKDRHRH